MITERILSRRDFLKYTMGAVVSMAVNEVTPTLGSQRRPLQRELPIAGTETKEVVDASIFQVFGVHGPAAADRDVVKSEQVILDATHVQAKSLLLQQPTAPMLDLANTARIQVITRIDQPQNIYTSDKLHECLRRHEGRIEQPIYQVGNEVNHEGVNGKKMHGKDYARTQFMPAARDILRYSNGILLLPPMCMAPEAKYTGEQFTYDFLTGIKEHEDFPLLQNNLVRIANAYHAYIYNPGEDYFPSMRKTDELTRAMLGASLPFYVTEAGLGQNPNNPYKEEVVAQELGRTLSLSLPKDLEIKSFNWWILGDDVYRAAPVSNDEQTGRNINELYAMHKKDGFTAAYNVASTYSPRSFEVFRDPNSSV